MPIGMALGGIASIAGSVLGGMFGSRGAKRDTAAMLEAVALDRARFREAVKRYNALAAELQPYQQFGRDRLTDFGAILTQDPLVYRDPGYDFRFREGLRGLEGAAASSGVLKSGDTLRALTRYGQEMGATEYGNAFNRYLLRLDQLRSAAQLGPQALSILSGAQANLNATGQQSAENIGLQLYRAEPGMSDRVWGNTIAGIGGMIGNMIAERFGGAKRS